MVDVSAYSASQALHAALVAALVGSAELAATAVPLPAGVVVGPQRGRGLPVVVIESETSADDPLAADDDARAAQHTKTVRVFGRSDAEARQIGDAVAVAALRAAPAGYQVIRATLDLNATGPDQDLSPTVGASPVGDRVVRLRYQIAPSGA